MNLSELHFYKLFSQASKNQHINYVDFFYLNFYEFQFCHNFASTKQKK